MYIIFSGLCPSPSGEGKFLCLDMISLARVYANPSEKVSAGREDDSGDRLKPKVFRENPCETIHSHALVSLSRCFEEQLSWIPLGMIV